MLQTHLKLRALCLKFSFLNFLVITQNSENNPSELTVVFLTTYTNICAAAAAAKQKK